MSAEAFRAVLLDDAELARDKVPHVMRILGAADLSPRIYAAAVATTADPASSLD